MTPTPHQRAEAELIAFGLTLPQTDTARGWNVTRTLRVTERMFAIFGDKGEPPDALTLIVKLPISAQMVQDLYFVRESRGWYRQHDWVIAHFGPDDDILREIDTLKGWLKQSYAAIAPKRISRQLADR